MSGDESMALGGEIRDDISLMALASAVIRRRSWITTLAVFGATIGLLTGLLSTRVYRSSATFIPQGAEAGQSGLALAASQFGIRVPASGGSWGPAVYVELLGSRAILEPLALDTVTVAEKGGARIAVLDLLGVKGGTREEQLDRTVQQLQLIVKANDVKSLNAVKFSVETRWASVSKQLADALVRGVNDFNYRTRKSQASAEREFVEKQAAAAEHNLRAAEEKLKDFALHNRSLASADLVLERERLQRDVALGMQVYTTLLQSREEARIREVRDTPVITLIEVPKRPVSGEARHSVQKAVYGFAAGAVIAVLLALLTEAVRTAEAASTPEGQEFVRLLRAAVPRWRGTDPRS